MKTNQNNGGNMGETITSPAKAIRKYCLECCREMPSEVKMCPATECVLYPFRFGKNPFRKSAGREWTDEAREEQRLKMLKMNEMRKENTVE